MERRNPEELRARLPEGFRIRAALPEDKEAVFEFCRYTWEWGDYIPRVWDAWLSNPKGRLLVATINDQPVAVAQVTLIAPEEAWLQGFRVAPDQRNQGIATALLQSCLQLAIELGARVARSAVLTSNISSRRIGAKLGFHQVASFVSYRADAAEGSPQHLSTANPQDLAVLLPFITESSMYKSSSGLYCTGWAFHKLTPEKLRNHLANKEVFTLSEIPELRALAIVTMSPLDEGIVIGYMAGSPEAMRDLAIGLRRQSAQNTPPQIEARLPDLASIRDTLTLAGYKPYTDEPFLIDELSLSKSPGG